MASIVPQSDASRPSAMDSYSLRQYMIHNGAAIIQKQRADASFVAQCGPCKNTMLPEQLLDACDTTQCVRRSTGAADGLGLGRDYGTAYISQHADIPGAFTVPSGGSPF